MIRQFVILDHFWDHTYVKIHSSPTLTLYSHKLPSSTGKIVTKRRTEWRESALNNTISPPKLVDFSCRVDTKIASDSLAKMSQSSLLLSLTVEDTPKKKTVIPDQTIVNLELSKQELAALLDGFTKIRDQLGAINTN